MNFLSKLLTQDSHGWWRIPKDESEVVPEYENPFGSFTDTLREFFSKITSAYGHATPAYYWFIAVLLAAVTIFEVWLFGVGLRQTVFITSMLVLSAMKFVLVVAFFMHLRFDHKQYTRVFIFCMLIGSLVYLALLLLNSNHGAGA